MKKFIGDMLGIFQKKVTWEGYLLCTLFFCGMFLFACFNLVDGSEEQQFVLLAQSFLKGHLSLGPSTISLDASYYNGQAYWPQGVFPALLLMPFVFFDHAMHQGSLEFVLNILNLFLLYKIARKITKNKTTAIWLSFAYLFATVYFVVGMFPWSWWYAQIVATSAVLLLLYEYFYQRRWFVMGIYIACAMATRIDLLLSVFFPLVLLVFAKQPVIRKLSQALLLISPVLLGLAIIFLYNFLRFGSVLEFGYRYHIPAITSAQQIFTHYGAWNIFYYPSNFYYLFLKGIDGVLIAGTGYLQYPFMRPNVWGMSIFLTSPIFLWCMKARGKVPEVKAAAFTTLMILLFLLGYFGIGARQYGYRYAMDFYPFLFVILCFAFQKGMGKWVKILIVISFLVNLFLFPSIFSLPLK